MSGLHIGVAAEVFFHYNIHISATLNEEDGELIRIPIPKDMKRGEVLELYQPIDARYELGVSDKTLNDCRLRGFIAPDNELIAVGRGYVYTREQLDACIKAKGWDRENINVKIEEVNSGE